MKVHSLSAFSSSEGDARVLERHGEEIIDSAIAALLSIPSREVAVKRIEAFGVSHETSVALVNYIERDSETRHDLARRSLKRAWLAGFGCVAAALILGPTFHKSFFALSALCAVYCGQSIVGWRKYSAKVE